MIAENQPEKQPSGENVPARAWLRHIPSQRRSTVANWFHYAVREGAHQPVLVLHAVRQTCMRRIHWGDTTDADTVLEALDMDPTGALAYAQHVIAYEAMPYEARQRVKAERGFAFLKESMRGKPVTPAQAALLRARGYRGPAPADRAEASALIDELQQGRGQR